MDFIDDGQGHPVRRLKQILDAAPVVNAPLDQLYTQILFTSSSIVILRKILGVIVVFFDPLPLLVIPTDGYKGITIYHKSLREFLQDSKRTNSYFIAPPLHHAAVPCHSFTLLTVKFERKAYALNHPELFSSALLYACRHWTLHLHDLPFNDGHAEKLEYLGLRRCLAKALQFVRSGGRWLADVVPVCSHPSSRHIYSQGLNIQFT